MVLTLFGRDQSLVGFDRSALVCRASLGFDWFLKFEPDVDEVPILLIAVGESDDNVEFKQWNVLPKVSTDKKG